MNSEDDHHDRIRYAQAEADLQRSLRRLNWTVVVLAILLLTLFLGSFVVSAIQRNEIRKVTATTTSALCTLRHNLEIRVAASRQFLKDHPNGIQGIPASAIEQDIANEQKTIDALNVLICPPFSSG
jgi:hypothetical protein